MPTPPARGMTATILRRVGAGGVDVVTVVGTLDNPLVDVVTPLAGKMRLTQPRRTCPAVALDVRASSGEGEQRQVVAVPVALDDEGHYRRDGTFYTAGGGYLVPDDSRMSALLRSLSGYAFDPAVPLLDRAEGGPLAPQR